MVTSRFVGDAQVVSNLEAPRGWQLYEAWFQQNLRVSALVGRYEINSEFHRLQLVGSCAMCRLKA